jgi:hypothetical protein
MKVIKKITVLFLTLLILIPINGLAAENSNISVGMNYLVLSPAEDGSTNVSVMADYANSASEEFKGDGNGEGVLKVSLPEGATNLKFLNSKIGFKPTDKGFITTDPIPANKSVGLQYSYQIPKGKEISVIYDYPVQIMQVLVPEGMGSVQFSGVQSSNEELYNIDNKNYWAYSVEGIKVNVPFTMTYNKDKQPAAAANTNTQSSSDNSGATSSVTRTAPDFHNPGHIRMWEQSALKNFNPHIFLIVILAIIIAGITSYAYFRRKTKLEESRVSNDKEEKAFKLLMSKQKAILDKILELEESHGNGEISEKDYHKKLDAYKEHLVQVKLNLREFVE